MDLGAFDQFVRRLTAEGSRRSMLKRLAGSAFGGTLTRRAGLDPRRRAKGNKNKGKDKGGVKASQV